MIPSFSLPNVIGNGFYGTFRAEAAFDFNEKHGLRFVFAPLETNDAGKSDPQGSSGMPESL